MDQYGIDKFSLVNFAVGVVWQQTGLSFLSLMIVYSIFKIVGNTSLGVHMADKYLRPLTGLKLVSEGFTNIGMDLLLCFAGWFAGHLLLGKTFHSSTGAFMGLLVYFWIPDLVTKYMLYIFPVMAALGLVFRPIWFLATGLGVGYSFDHYTLVKNSA